MGFNRTLLKQRATAYAIVKNLERIEELDYHPTARYLEASKEAVLHPLIDASKCILVPSLATRARARRWTRLRATLG